jgi:uncharacterized YccA/Bax inhibitor family protein
MATTIHEQKQEKERTMGNPALSDKTFEKIKKGSEGMTLKGTVQKTTVLFIILMAVAGATWHHTLGKMEAVKVEVVEGAGEISRLAAVPSGIMPLVFGGLIAGFVVALITIFNPKGAPYTAPIYAALEGLSIGALSAMFEYMYPGIGLQAIACTLGTFVVMLVAYGIFGVNQKFAAGVMAATGGICLFYIILMGMMLFGCGSTIMSSTSPLSIGLSVVICAVAAFNLMLDFDTIERGVSEKAPKYMEWYCGFALLVTVIWLYLEILRLLAKLKSK